MRPPGRHHHVNPGHDGRQRIVERPAIGEDVPGQDRRHLPWWDHRRHRSKDLLALDLHDAWGVRDHLRGVVRREGDGPVDEASRCCGEELDEPVETGG